MAFPLQAALSLPTLENYRVGARGLRLLVAYYRSEGEGCGRPDSAELLLGSALEEEEP